MISGLASHEKLVAACLNMLNVVLCEGLRATLCCALLLFLGFCCTDLAVANAAHAEGRGGGGVEVTPWGDDSLRVIVGRDGTSVSPQLSPVLPRDDAKPVPCASGGLTNDNLRVECSASGRVFYRVSDGAVLIEESVTFDPLHHSIEHSATSSSWPPPTAPSGVTVTMRVGSSEVYGLGQQRATCYPEGGRQTQPLARAFAPGQVIRLVHSHVERRIADFGVAR